MARITSFNFIAAIATSAILLALCCCSSAKANATPVNFALGHHALTDLTAVPSALAKSQWAPAVANVPLGGNIAPLGIYYFNVEVGNPPRTFKVALDTGSSDLVIPAKGCVGCHLANTSAYDPNTSATSRRLACGSAPYCPASTCVKDQCGFSNTYETCNLTAPDQPCTVSGPVYSDEVLLAGSLRTRVVFGAITMQTPNFQQFFVIDGVIGFANNPAIGTLTTFDLLYKDGQVKENVFSICMNFPYAYPHSGVITLGGLDSRLYVGDVRYTAGLNKGYYEIGMDAINVGGHAIKAPWTGSLDTIIDSGTNTLLLNTPTVTALKTYFIENYCGDNKLVGVCTANTSATLFDGFCFEMTQSQINAFPAIDLIISGNIPLTMKSSDYLLVDQNAGTAAPTKYCLGILPTGNTGFTIIGDIVMQNYYFVFDNDKSRIGFARVNRNNCLAAATGNKFL